MNIILLGDLSQAFTELLSEFVSGLPNFIYAVLLFIGGYILARLISGIVRKGLKKLNVDSLGAKLNQIELFQKVPFDISISQILSKITFYIVLLIFLIAATDVLKMEAVSRLVMDIFSFIPHLLIALVVFLLGTLLADFIRSIVYTTCKSLGIPSARMISTFLFYFLFINVVVSALMQANINIDFLSQNLSLIIGGAILAFAIGYGLASKEVVANYLASYYTKGKLHEGDLVTIQGVKGVIIEIDNSTVTLEKEMGKIIFPLHKLMHDKIEIHNKSN